MNILKQYWLDQFHSEQTEEGSIWERKKQLCKKRGYEIIRIRGSGEVFQTLRVDNQLYYSYILHVSFLMKRDQHFYIEEQAVPYQFHLAEGMIAGHTALSLLTRQKAVPTLSLQAGDERGNDRFIYDRRAAVQYAERWWNDYNPDYRAFPVDCTNYVSQCLKAGGAPMRGAPDRDKGWWYSNDNWSYSWSVAHSLRWYLSGSTTGLKGKEIEDPQDLEPGDVICYDFSGDGRFDHNTIVVAKDVDGYPLVNAHTDNSRHRYWSYEDSLAWTPNCKYKFFRIGE
ncbi:MAG TPA: amidase domain-containing protein [Bacillota bacterium]|nr:amidase domain-containing protein [Bacillota bacterium]